MGFGGRLSSLLAVGGLLVALAGCGRSSTSRAGTPGPSATTTPSAASTGGSVSSGPFHASFKAPNHRPTVGKPWHYSVHVTDAHGHPLSGTVKIQFTFGGQVVGTDTPP